MDSEPVYTITERARPAYSSISYASDGKHKLRDLAFSGAGLAFSFAKVSSKSYLGTRTRKKLMLASF